MVSTTIARLMNNRITWYRYPNLMTVIINLCHADKKSISSFAEYIGKRYANILDIVRFMVERGFLDKRKGILYVTDKGQDLSYDLNKVGMDLF